MGLERLISGALVACLPWLVCACAHRHADRAGSGATAERARGRTLNASRSGPGGRKPGDPAVKPGTSATQQAIRDPQGDGPAEEADREAIQHVVVAHAGAIEGCYAAQLAEHPQLAGTIVFEWQVAEDGTVRWVRSVSSTIDAPAIGDCIAKLIYTWRFPRREQGPAQISYPFVFRREQR